MDALVLDPTYAEGHLRSKPETRTRLYHEHYGAPHGAVSDNGERWYAAVVALYAGGFQEAKRVLRLGGVAIAKCQDQISSNRLRHCISMLFAKRS